MTLQVLPNNQQTKRFLPLDRIARMKDLPSSSKFFPHFISIAAPVSDPAEA
jgi:hypothetical protein